MRTEGKKLKEIHLLLTFGLVSFSNGQNSGNIYSDQKLMKFVSFWCQKLTHSFWFRNYAEPFFPFLGQETDKMCQLLGPETVKMGQHSFWPQKLTLWVCLWALKLTLQREILQDETKQMLIVYRFISDENSHLLQRIIVYNLFYIKK